MHMRCVCFQGGRSFPFSGMLGIVVFFGGGLGQVLDVGVWEGLVCQGILCIPEGKGRKTELPSPRTLKVLVLTVSSTVTRLGQ